MYSIDVKNIYIYIYHFPFYFLAKCTEREGGILSAFQAETFKLLSTVRDGGENIRLLRPYILHSCTNFAKCDPKLDFRQDPIFCNFCEIIFVPQLYLLYNPTLFLLKSYVYR